MEKMISHKNLGDYVVVFIWKEKIFSIKVINKLFWYADGKIT